MGVSRIRWFFFNERGISLMELLVTLSVTGIVFGGIVSQYLLTTRSSHDQAIRTSTNLKAQAVAQTIGAELRVLGNGVPFDQANFQISDNALSDPTVTEPIKFATTTNSSISFRLNESGQIFMLTSAFDPAISLSISLTEVGELAVNDPIYLSNSVVSGDDGLYGEITAVNAGSNSVTISAGYVTRAGASFPVGSILEEVPLVTINSPADGSGITRDSGFGPVLLSENSTLALSYFTQDGSPVTLPLDAVKLTTQLRAIDITVSVSSPREMRDGTTYTATVTHRIGLRNLNYLY